MGKKSGSGIRDKHVGSATLGLGIVLIRKIRFFSTETFFYNFLIINTWVLVLILD
jgi:hypothetical protein